MFRMLTNMNLPINQYEFHKTLNLYCPTIYDVKCMAFDGLQFRGGLEGLASNLQVILEFQYDKKCLRVIDT